MAQWLRLLGILAFSLCIPYSAPAAEAEHKPQQSVEKIMVDLVDGGDRNAALLAARRTASRTATERAVTRFVDESTRAKNAGVLETDVLARASDFTLVRPVSTHTTGGRVSAEFEVTVQTLPLTQVLRQKGLMRQWRVMVIIPELHVGRPLPDPAAETEFIRQFVRAGFKVIDPARYAELRRENVERLQDPRVAAEIGRRFGADVVIVGKGISERGPDIEGFASCQARVEARALLADTAEIVASDARTGTEANTTESVAAKKALQSAATKLAPLFIADVSLLPNAQTRKIQVEVGVFPNFSAAARFERAVSSIAGVNSVTRESYDAGVLVLEVDADVEAADALAEKLETSKQLTDYRFTVDNVSRTRIRARVAAQNQ